MSTQKNSKGGSGAGKGNQQQPKKDSKTSTTTSGKASEPKRPKSTARSGQTAKGRKEGTGSGSGAGAGAGAGGRARSSSRARERDKDNDNDSGTEQANDSGTEQNNLDTNSNAGSRAQTPEPGPNNNGDDNKNSDSGKYSGGSGGSGSSNNNDNSDSRKMDNDRDSEYKIKFEQLQRDFHKESAQLRQTISDLRTELKVSKEQLETERTERENIERELAEMRTHGKDDEQGSDELNSTKLRASLGLQDKRLSEEDFDKDLRQYAEELHNITIENREIKANLHSKEEMIKNLKTENERLNQLTNKAQQELIEHKSSREDVEELEKDLETSEKELQKMINLNQQLKDNLKGLEEIVRNREEEIKQLKPKSEENENLQKKIKEFNIQLNEIRKNAEQVNKEKEELSVKLLELTKIQEKTLKENEEIYEKQMQNTKGAYVENEKELKQCKDEIISLKIEIGHLMKENEKLLLSGGKDINLSVNLNFELQCSIFNNQLLNIPDNVSRQQLIQWYKHMKYIICEIIQDLIKQSNQTQLRVNLLEKYIETKGLEFPEDIGFTLDQDHDNSMLKNDQDMPLPVSSLTVKDLEDYFPNPGKQQLKQYLDLVFEAWRKDELVMKTAMQQHQETLNLMQELQELKKEQQKEQKEQAQTNEQSQNSNPNSNPNNTTDAAPFSPTQQSTVTNEQLQLLQRKLEEEKLKVDEMRLRCEAAETIARELQMELESMRQIQTIGIESNQDKKMKILVEPDTNNATTGEIDSQIKSENKTTTEMESIQNGLEREHLNINAMDKTKIDPDSDLEVEPYEIGSQSYFDLESLREALKEAKQELSIMEDKLLETEMTNQTSIVNLTKTHDMQIKHMQLDMERLTKNLQSSEEQCNELIKTGKINVSEDSFKSQLFMQRQEIHDLVKRNDIALSQKEAENNNLKKDINILKIKCERANMTESEKIKEFIRDNEAKDIEITHLTKIANQVPKLKEDINTLQNSKNEIDVVLSTKDKRITDLEDQIRKLTKNSRNLSNRLSRTTIDLNTALARKEDPSIPLNMPITQTEWEDHKEQMKMLETRYKELERSKVESVVRFSCELENMRDYIRRLNGQTSRRPDILRPSISNESGTNGPIYEEEGLLNNAWKYTLGVMENMTNTLTQTLSYAASTMRGDNDSDDESSIGERHRDVYRSRNWDTDRARSKNKNGTRTSRTTNREKEQRRDTYKSKSKRDKEDRHKKNKKSRHGSTLSLSEHSESESQRRSLSPVYSVIHSEKGGAPAQTADDLIAETRLEQAKVRESYINPEIEPEPEHEHDHELDHENEQEKELLQDDIASQRGKPKSQRSGSREPIVPTRQSSQQSQLYANGARRLRQRSQRHQERQDTQTLFYKHGRVVSTDLDTRGNALMRELSQTDDPISKKMKQTMERIQKHRHEHKSQKMSFRGSQLQTRSFDATNIRNMGEDLENLNADAFVSSASVAAPVATTTTNVETSNLNHTDASGGFIGRQPDIPLAEPEMDTQSDIGVIADDKIEVNSYHKELEKSGMKYSVGSYQLDMDLGDNGFRFGDDDLMDTQPHDTIDQDVMDYGDIGDFPL